MQVNNNKIINYNKYCDIWAHKLIKMAKNKQVEIDYKIEGKRRSQLRKSKRYNTFKSRGNGHCNHGSHGWHSCPFQQDMNDNDDSRYCQCCSECRNDCAMDI